VNAPDATLRSRRTSPRRTGPRRTRAVDFGLAATGAIAFGTTVLFSRIVAKNGLGPLTALGVRFAAAGLLLFGVLTVRRRPLLPPPGERMRALLLGMVVYALESTFFFMALERGTAAAVTLLFYSYPAVVTGVELLLGEVAPRPSVFLALALSMGGAFAVAVGGGEVSITLAGAGFVVGSVLFFSCYALGSARLLHRTDSLTAAAWTAVGASASLLTVGAVTGELRAPGSSLAPLLGNGVATAAAFTLFFVALDRLGASRTAVVMTLEAASAVVLAAVFLGEAIRLLEVIGGVAVLGGAALAGLVTPAHTAAHEVEPP